MFERIHNLTDRKYKALIGMGKKDFQQLTVVYSECYQEQKAQEYEDFVKKHGRKPNGGGNPIFKTPSEQLFFTLFYLKTYPTFDVLGFIFNCSGKAAHENLYKFLPILERALDTLKVLPIRKFETVQEFVEFTKEHGDLLIDATERLHHRKKNYDEQKKFYNGKKKPIQLKIQ